MQLETYVHTHILGGLYGLALADAWSMPAYLRLTQTWSYYNGWVDELLPAPPDHPLYAGYQAGQITQNSQQAIILAKAIVAKQGNIAVEDVVQAIIDWYDQLDGDNSLLIDAETRQAILALKTGADPAVTGQQGSSSSSAIRGGIIGLIYPGNIETAIEAATTACIPTHFTDAAVSATCAVAAAVAQATTPDTLLVDIIDAAVLGADRGFRQGTPWFGPSVARKIDYAVQLATDLSLPERDRIQNLHDLIGSTQAAADAIPCAFGILAMADGHPLEVATYSAALSGNASTVGAIAGVIAGAWHGVDPIPLEFIETLRRANPYFSFEETAEELYEIALLNRDTSPRHVEDLLDDIANQDQSSIP